MTTKAVTTGYRGIPALSEAEARELTESIKADLQAVYSQVVKAYRGRAWLPLGYTSWAEYCKAEFAGLFRKRFNDDELTDVCRTLMEEGLSLRSVSAVTGVSLGKVHKHAPKDRPDRLLGADGKERGSRRLRIVSDETPAVTEIPETIDVAKLSQSDWATLMVGESGAQGMTYKELSHTADGWGHPQSSCALSRAARRGQVIPSGKFRDGCTVYVVPAYLSVIR